jgi:hypothetical protein
MGVTRKYALPLALMVLVVALAAGSYLWFKASMRVADLPKLAPRREAEIQSREPGLRCADPVRLVEVPCPATDPLVEAAREGDVKKVAQLLERAALS